MVDFFLTPAKTHVHLFSRMKKERRAFYMGALILVAEEEDIARASLSDLLRLDGYRVIEAGDKYAAINGLEKNGGVDAVLSDLEMRGWRSVASCALALHPKTYLLGMVRSGALPDKIELQHSSIEDCLVKPLLYEDVRSRIAGALRVRDLR
jgi:DNA-binding response OmpR family regulator